MTSLLLAALLCVDPPAGAEEKELQVLFIGNSYTEMNELPWMVLQLARADGIPMRYEQVTGGGMQLEHHWANGKGDAVKKLAQRKWDVVVLQEHSARPIDEPAKYLQYAKAFDAKVKAAGAKTLLYVTWAKKGQPEQQPKLDKAFGDAAKELKATLVPVAAAWERAAKEKPGLELYDEDGSHPTPLATYLTALVFHRVLHGKPAKNPPKKIAYLGNVLVDIEDAETIPFLQRMAAGP